MLFRSVVNIVDVGHVVLGGVYATLAPHLVDAVGEQLRRRVISAPWSDLEIDVALARQYPAMTGGALTVLEALVADPAEWLGEDAEAPSRDA